MLKIDLVSKLFFLFDLFSLFPQFSLFGSNAEVEIKLDDCEKRTQLEVKKGNHVEKQYLFFGKEPIKGVINVKPSKKLEHLGAKVELVGCIGKFDFFPFRSLLTLSHVIPNYSIIFFKKWSTIVVLIMCLHRLFVSWLSLGSSRRGFNTPLTSAMSPNSMSRTMACM